MNEQTKSQASLEDAFQAAEESVSDEMVEENVVAGPDDIGGPVWNDPDGESEPEPESEDAGADVEASEDEGAESDEVDEPESEPESVRDWDHQTDSLPDEAIIDGVRYDLKGIVQDFNRGFQAKVQEVAAARKEAESARAHYERLVSNLKAGEDDPRPPLPTQDMSQSEYDAAYEKYHRWVARDEQRRAEIAAAAKRAPAPAQGAPAEDYSQDPAYQRGLMVRQQEGFTQPIADEMMKIMSEDQFWAEQSNTDAGILKLFELVKTKHEAAGLKKQAVQQDKESIRRKAGAKKRAVSTPSTSRKMSPVAESFAKKLEEGTATWADAEAAS